VRGGKTQTLSMPVPLQRPLLIDSLRGDYPSYFIYGPLVFSRVTIESLALMRGRGSFSPLLARFGDPPGEDREELVMIPAPLFPHALSKGYSNPAGEVVSAINGVPERRIRGDRLRQPLRRGPGFCARQIGGGYRGDPQRQRRALAGLGRHDEGLAVGEVTP
jgi:hypothetical protein